VAALLTIDLLGVGLFAWFCLVKVLPDCNVSIYRYRLWRVRDRLADQIRWGQFDDARAPTELLQRVERFIVTAPEIGIVKLLFMRLALRGCPAEPDLLEREGLSRDDRRRLELIVRELQSINARHVAFGSPSGWILTFLLVPVALVVIAIERLNQRGVPHGSVLDETRDRIRHEASPSWNYFDSEDTGSHPLTRAI
jgi:hypothetical protein